MLASNQRDSPASTPPVRHAGPASVPGSATAIKRPEGQQPHDEGMNGSADTFLLFVAVLSDALDDHEATGAELAARAHLSRFHFDRIIKAAAGEPPATFRRRVLLERAAYRLLTGARSVLDVGMEAGYSSHEAFTRAFTRAYGAPPRQWRRQPSHIHIPAPSNVHFHPPGSLRFPASGEVTSMDLLLKMVDHHAWLVGEMLARAATLRDEQLDTRIEISVEGVDDEPTLRSLLSRLVGQMDMWNSVMELRNYDFAVEEGESIEHMRARFARVAPAFAGQVRAVCGAGRLGDTFVNTQCEPVEVFTYGGMIAHVLTFAAHRRTLVVGALHDAGIPDLGAGDPMRWVAEN